jgi:SAM-dependent methyltransferase
MADEQSKIWAYYQNYLADSFEGAKPRLNYIAQRILSRARHIGKFPPEVLNIGVGNGYLEETLLAAGAHIHSLDPDSDAVVRLQAKGIDAHQGFIQTMPFETEMFDAVIVSEVLEHLSDDIRTSGLSEIARVLRDDGVIYGTVPYREKLSENFAVCPRCGEVFHRWGHQVSFDLEDLGRELSSYFKVTVLRSTAFVALTGSVLERIKEVGRLAFATFGVAVSGACIYFEGVAKHRPT